MNRAISLSILLFLNFGYGQIMAQNTLEIDTTYGFNGTNEFWLEINGIIHELKIADSYLLPDNKLLCAGNTMHCYHPWKNYGVLFVMDQSGKLDTTYFDGMGYHQFLTTVTFTDMLATPDGDFLLLTVTNVVKINLETGIDQSFANSGFLNLPFQGSAIYFDPNGNLLVRGSQQNFASPDNRDHFLAKYSSTTEIDSSFGTNGILKVFPTESANYFNGIKFDSAGNYYLIGTSRYDYNFVDKHILVTKLFPNGDLDSTYANNGRYEDSNLYRSINGGSYVTEQDELIIRGNCDPTSADPNTLLLMMLKLDATGSLDTTFGTNGYTMFQYPTGTGSLSIFQPLPTGGFLLGGSGGYPNKSIFLARCSDDGIIDQNYGDEGFRYYSLPYGTSGLSNGYLIDDKFVAYGVTSDAACAQTMWKSWFRRFAVGELNNSCSDASPLTVFPQSECPDSATVGSIAYCTPSGISSECDNDSMPDVYYTFDTDSIGSIIINFHSENENSYVLEILESCGGNSLMCTITADTVLTAELSPNTSYIIRVAGDSSIAANETFTICLSSAPESIALSGNINLVGNCGSESANFAFYIPASNSLLFTSTVPIGSAGEYSILLDSVGTFDVLISVSGFLDKGYAEVHINPSENHLDANLLKNSDINGDGFINFFDVSIISIAFFTQSGGPNFNPAADLNCDGIINMMDISLLASSFMMMGDTVPLQ